MAKRKKQGAYMISSVAEMYDIHPQTLRLYEREGLLKPSRTEGNTRLYTDEDIERLELILSLARDLGVNISGIAIIIQMRERMEEMQRQMTEFVNYVRNEVVTRVATRCGRSQPRRHRPHSPLDRSGEETLLAISVCFCSNSALLQTVLCSNSALLQLCIFSSAAATPAGIWRLMDKTQRRHLDSKFSPAEIP